jgi:hypothetical protein
MTKGSRGAKRSKKLQIAFLTAIVFSCLVIWAFLQSSAGLIVSSYARGLICKLMSNGTIRHALEICYGI